LDFSDKKNYKIYVSISNFETDEDKLEFEDFIILKIHQGSEAKKYREILGCKKNPRHILIKHFKNYEIIDSYITGFEGINNILGNLLLIFRLFKPGDIIFGDNLIEDLDDTSRYSNVYSLDKFSIFKYSFQEDEIGKFENFKKKIIKKPGFNNRLYNFSFYYFQLGISRGFANRLEYLNRIVDYFTALESIFILDSERNQKTRILKNRIKNFLEEDSASEIIEKFYDIRGRIVHGDFVFKEKSELEAKIERIKNELHFFEELVRKIYIRLLDYKFKEKKELEIFLNDLYVMLDN